MTETVQNLVEMSRALGEPAHDYVILGEGNSSAREYEETFWVKASGTSLNGIDKRGFVQVRLSPILALLEDGDASDGAVKAALAAAMVDPQSGARPSVETTFHAVALTLGEANYVGHTHPTAVNAILCSVQAREAFAGRLFPDEVVVCGPAPVFVPYTDPGLPLALSIRQEITRYKAEYDRAPKVVLLQNHGLIALGKSAAEVLRITAMLVKTARIILGAYTMGGPHFLSQADVDRIDTRPDELYRRTVLAEKAEAGSDQALRG